MLPGATTAGSIGAGGADPTTINVLSSRADLVAGGEALVEIVLPGRALHWTPTVAVNGSPITDAFSHRAGLRVDGLVTGLTVGPNVLRVALPDGTGALLTLINHPSGGPVFAGPQIQPWRCEPGAADSQCDKNPQFQFEYVSTNPMRSGFQPYNLASPPADVASTTTDGGVTVPFIVRVETGYVDRDQYRIASLFQPGKPWDAVDPQPQFDHKLLITHGASCDLDYEVGNAPSVISFDPANVLGLSPQGPFRDSVQYALGKGFAVMSTALDNSGHNCDVVTQAESLLMAKQHLIDTYGTLRYTIGTGCSGGSLAQQWIANAYPGIYQGILPTCSFPDAWSSATQVTDYHLLRAYFEHPSHWGSGIVWSPSQWAAVEGNALPVDAILSDSYSVGGDPTHDCGGVSAEQRYQPQANPGGVRCSVADLAISVFGPRPRSDWSPNEIKIGHGFASAPVDNVGVQYGVSALQNLQITPAQFVDLNATIGGLDIDLSPTPGRINNTEPALSRAYRSGMINEANNLGQTAIIDCRGPDPGAAHDSYRAFAVRARLDRANGTHANQVIWEGSSPIIADTLCALNSLSAMDQWLAAVARDNRQLTTAAKVIADRPTSVTDECWDGIGNRLTHDLCPPGVVPVYGTPRTVAGDAITTDTNKCQLKPLNRSDYRLPFTPQQWAQLQAIFPTGVCDYSKPAVDQQPTMPWLTYQDASGRVIYGGVPLGAPPRSHPF
jgi:hypothetical protein